MAKFAAEDMNATKAVIYCDNSSDYGKGLAQYFEKTFTENGVPSWPKKVSSRMTVISGLP
ncbi:MAG: hypothetical protein RQM92_00735 [Candidatus Syntrophopropionicum ammoniitolerans]